MEELDWSAETSGVTFNADLEPKTHHRTPMIVHMGTVILDISKTGNSWKLIK